MTQADNDDEQRARNLEKFHLQLLEQSRGAAELSDDTGASDAVLPDSRDSGVAPSAEYVLRLMERVRRHQVVCDAAPGVASTPNDLDRETAHDHRDAFDGESLPQEARDAVVEQLAWLQAELDAAPDGHQPRKIGRFEIERLLGRGGFGLVFLAFDPRLQRRVALKIPRLDSLVTGQLSGRFMREAKAAALLSHPHIVTVFEAGFVGPAVYIASHYVPGRNLAEWLSDRDQKLNSKQVAQVMSALTSAVQHAHSRSVIHRDLKPSNIQVDESSIGQVTGELTAALGNEPAVDSDYDALAKMVKISDFGLARMTTAGEFPTASGTVLGTPAYMAPEQARGTEPTGPAVDIYGLGSILYELLTGQPPHVHTTLAATLRALELDEPLAPRRLNPSVPADLEAICLKALEKNPDQRYASAFAMEADLQRFLADEPVVARPLGQLRRWERWCRRRPALAATSGLALASLLIGLVLVAALWQRAERHLAFATSESTRANHAAQQAREAADYARHALDTMTSQVATEWLSAQNQVSPEQKEFLLTAVSHYRKFASESADGKSQQRSVAGAAFQLGKLLQKLGEFSQAEAAYRQALEMRLALREEGSSTAEDTLELARTYQALDVILRTAGRYDEAKQANQEAILLLTKSRQAQPEDQQLQHELADAYTNQGNLLRTMGQLDQAADVQLLALEIRRTLVADSPDRSEFQQKLSLVLNNVALVRVNQQQWAEAEPLLEEALAIKQQLVADFPDELKFAEDLGLGLTNHGAFLHKLQRLPEAEEYASRGIDSYARLSNDYPSRPQYRHMHGAGLLTRGIILRGMDDLEQAASCFAQANKILAELSRQHPDAWTYLHQSAAALLKLADMSRDREQLIAATDFYSQAIEPLEAFHRRQPTLGPIQQMLHNAMIGRATVRAWSGEFDDSLADWDRAVELSPPDMRAAWRLARGTTLVRAGRVDEAVSEASELTRDSQDISVLFNGACVFAVAAGATSADEPTAQSHAQECYALLRRSIALGFTDSATLRNDRDFRAIQLYPEFQAIIDDMQDASAQRQSVP